MLAAHLRVLFLCHPPSPLPHCTGSPTHCRFPTGLLALVPTPYPATIILAEFHAHTATIPHVGPQVLSLFVSNKQFPLAQGILIKKKKNLFLSFVAVCSPLPSNDPKANPSSLFQAADKYIFTIFQK